MRPPIDDFDTALTTAIAGWGLSISTPQLTQLRVHFTTLVSANLAMNLTRITEPTEAAVKHYADSLALLGWVRDRAVDVETVLDVGTGGGFPALPLAVMRPDWTVTAIDGTGRKIEFLRQTAAAIGLRNLRCEHAHSRHWKPRRSFQVIVFRAVAALSIGLKQAVKHVARGGWIVAYKTASIGRAEQEGAAKVVSTLRLRSCDPYPYGLQFADERLERALLIYRKPP